MNLGLGVNEYGTIVSRHLCNECGREFTVCPAVEEREFGGVCLSPDCASYDPERDADRFFAGGDRHRELRRKEGSNG